MTTKELRKEYNEQWKKENPTKYMVWWICYMGELIPCVVMFLQILDGGRLNDKKVSTIVICLTVMFVLSTITLLIASEQKKEWKEYLKKNRDRLK